MGTITSTTRITKTVVLKPGESFTLPPGGELVFTSDPTGTTSDCVIPTDVTMECAVIQWSLNADRTPSSNLEHQDSLVTAITFGQGSTNTYEVNLDTYAIFSGGGDDAVKDALQAKVPTSLMNIDHVTTDTTGARNTTIVYFRTLSIYVNDVYATLNGPGYELNLFVQSQSSSDCSGES